MKIIVDHVSKTIKGIDILTDISMVLTSGHIVGFQGVNGSGKINRHSPYLSIALHK